MKVKSAEEYCNKLIEFYKNYQTEDKQLKKLIIRNLHDIKNRYLKEIAKYKQQEGCKNVGD